MAAKPPFEPGATARAIYMLHEAREQREPARGYLGWSQLGEPCERALFYSFRLAEREKIEGRMVRLFGGGHIEESRVLQELRDLGYEVFDRDGSGKQFAVSSVGGHLRGHADAVVRGLPEAPDVWHLVDVKTASAKNFDAVVKQGLRAKYPKYYAQGIGYAGLLDLQRCAFIFVCKDDDRVHVEFFDFDQAEFDRLAAKAGRIINAKEPPIRAGVNADDLTCKFCAYKGICHGTDAPQVNCRTCVSATPVLDGEGSWVCDASGEYLTTEHQRKVHACHRYIPPMLSQWAQAVDATDDGVVYEMGGVKFVNGRAPGYASHEIRAATDKRMLVDRDVQRLKLQFRTAKVVKPEAPALTGTGFDEMESDIPW